MDEQSHPRYQLIDKIASGSFATVYRGRDLELGREVAIKQIHQQYLEDPQQLDRYWGEAQLLASFQHPNIVTIYDIARERGWLILELMQSDLSKVAGRKQMPLESLRTTLAHCLRALKFLHTHGIVHGDIKPSNMMIDRRRRVKIGDFGLARRVSNEEGSLIKGTTKYMAPEVVSDEFGEVGPASDLYSLGFAAYELMCGENFEELFPGLNAFGRDRQMAWMMWHAAPDRRLPEIERVLADVPADLARTIQKLTAKPQAQRYKNADEALSDLNIDIKLVKAGEESVVGLGRTHDGTDNRRRRLIIGAVAASVLLSLAVLFIPSGGESPAPPIGKAKALAGVIREVLPKDEKVVFDDESGVPDEIVVGRKPRIRLDNDGPYLQLKELAPGDRIEIRFDETANSRTCVINALRPQEGSGKIKEVDAAASKLTVTLAADPHPQDVPMFVPERAKLTLNGKLVKVAELLPDDRVKVSHLKDTEGRAPRDVIRLDALRTVSTVGFVKEIATRSGRFWLVIDHLRNESQIEFADDCRITVNGHGEVDGRKLAPGDLKKGDRVEVHNDTQATAVVAVRRENLTGATLIKIDPSSRAIVVQPDKVEGHVTLTVGDDCEITRDDKPTDITGLRDRDVLDITFEPQEEGPGVARTIEARAPR
jgi:serine/threonine-protein kinase